MRKSACLRKKIPRSKEKMWGCFEKRAAGQYTTPWDVCLYRRGRPVLDVLGVGVMRGIYKAPRAYGASALFIVVKKSQHCKNC